MHKLKNNKLLSSPSWGQHANQYYHYYRYHYYYYYYYYIVTCTSSYYIYIYIYVSLSLYIYIYICIDLQINICVNAASSVGPLTWLHLTLKVWIIANATYLQLPEKELPLWLHRHLHTCHILPPSGIDWGLFLVVFTGSEGKHLFHRIGWKGRTWQLWPTNSAKVIVWAPYIYIYIYI